MYFVSIQAKEFHTIYPILYKKKTGFHQSGIVDSISQQRMAAEPSDVHA